MFIAISREHKRGEVSLYSWPPVWPVWISLFCKYKKNISCHTADSKPVKQEVNTIVILPPLVFPAISIVNLVSSPKPNDASSHLRLGLAYQPLWNIMCCLKKRQVDQLSSHQNLPLSKKNFFSVSSDVCHVRHKFNDKKKTNLMNQRKFNKTFLE